MASTTSCPFCGMELRARTLDVAGRTIFAGYEPCQCDGAVRQREADERAEADAAERERYERRRRAYERAGIMPRYSDAEHPMAHECAELAEGGSNLYICGGVGTGKTMLAAVTLRILVDHGVRVRLSSMWKILDAIKDGFKDGSDPLPEYQRVRCLVLDDLGKESPTDFALERIFALVDERYNRMLPTIVTTQYKPGMLIEHLAKNGDKDTAIAVVSRLRDGCEVVELGGRDRRLDG